MGFGSDSFGLIPLGAKLVDFQIGTEDVAGGGSFPVVTQVDLAAPDAVVRSVLVLEPSRAGWPDVAYPVPEGWLPLPALPAWVLRPSRTPQFAWTGTARPGCSGRWRVSASPSP